MSNFKREEEKYLVVKASDLQGAGIVKRAAFFSALHGLNIPARKFLVIESDWPEYQIAWGMIQARVEGVDTGEESENMGLQYRLGVMTADRDALQQRLTAADEELDRAGGAYLKKNAECLQLRKRADVLEGLLRDCKAIFKRGVSEIGFMSHASLHNRMECEIEEIDAALKPAEGVGDDTTIQEEREDAKKVFVRTNTKQGQSISLADMQARYEPKP